MPNNHNFTGLTDAEVLESRRKNGVNILTPPKQDPWWKEFLDKFSDPLIIILLVAGVLSIGISFYEFFGLGQDWKVFLSQSVFLLPLVLLRHLPSSSSRKPIKHLRFSIRSMTMSWLR